MEFKHIKTAVAAQFAFMAKHPLFRTAATKDALWTTYLGAFPEGSNPIYKTRTEHDCNCCKQFIRAVGDVVAIIDGQLVSIWDVPMAAMALGPEYAAVCGAMSELVKSEPIVEPFLHYEKTAGTDKNLQDTLDGVKTWNHFFVNIPAQFVKPGKDIAAILGEQRALHDVLLRSLMEIDGDAVNTVLELIAQNSLYRGEEHKFAVSEFKKLQAEFDKQNEYAWKRDRFVWSRIGTLPASVSKIRNTSIGTLLVDLSEGKDLEYAVKSFEQKVAPANYKRPTALVTKAMIEAAKVTITELGLGSALERRYATIDDITINNILFADRGAKKSMGADIFDTLGAGIAEKPKAFDKVEEVGIEKFIADILPRAQSIEMLVENRHVPNFVSLIAPVDPTAGQLFKWGNQFSWDYNGNLADSDIRQAVQAKGGRVDGVFRFSHSWNHDKRNTSLMDLHVFLPDASIREGNGRNDVYGNSERVGWNNRTHHRSGGVQDVDYTGQAPVGYIPVENITFPTLSKMPEGVYVCKIHNWQFRNPTLGGFKAEIEFGGELYQYEYDKPLQNKEWVTVAEVTLKNGVFSIKHHLPTGTSSKEVWNVPTQTFRPVNVVMMSPNFWDLYPNSQQVRSEVKVGNKHYFFMLDGCRHEGQARGFYNEFLKSELDQHRKVIEMVGAKMKTENSEHQLSGLGFSSTQRNSVVVRVKGSFTRNLKVVF